MNMRFFAGAWVWDSSDDILIRVAIILPQEYDKKDLSPLEVLELKLFRISKGSNIARDEELMTKEG